MLGASFSPSGEQILTGSEEGTARLWDTNGRELAVFGDRLRASEISSFWNKAAFATFSPSGKYICVSLDGTARLLHARGEDLLQLANDRTTRDFTEEELRVYAGLLGEEVASVK